MNIKYYSYNTMGIKDFTKVFEPDKIVEFNKLEKDIKFKKKIEKAKVVIDAMPEIYRAALGMEKVHGLTDSQGNPTNHITTILYGTILKLKKYNVRQYWVFDNEENYVKGKENEIKKRNKVKNKSEIEFKQQEKDKQIILDSISDIKASLNSEIDENKRNDLSNKLEILEYNLEVVEEKLNKLDKSGFRIKKFYIEDLKKILDFLNIPYVICPKGYDAEYLCAKSTHDKNIFGVKMNYVFTIDADALVFGAKRLLKRKVQGNLLYEYTLAKLLDKYDLIMDDFIKISIILGSDFAEKTKRIGPKTVLTKYKNIELNEEQLRAYDIFTQEISTNDIENIKRFNIGKKPFKDINQIIEWLVWEKSFNVDRVKKIFKNNGLY